MDASVAVGDILAGKYAVERILANLIIPADALWRLAAYYLMPSILRDLAVTPFSGMYPPSGAMVFWAIGYIIVVAWIGIRQFDNRAL